MTAFFSTRRRKHRYCARLGIRDLSESAAALRAVGAYVLYADPSDARDAVAFGTARASRARQTTLAMAREPGSIVRCLQVRNDASPRPGWPPAFNVLAAPSVAAGAGSAVALARVAGGLASLKAFAPPSGALYILEGVDNWFDWEDAGRLGMQMDYVVDWSRAWRCCVVLVLGLHGRNGIPGHDGEEAHAAAGRVAREPDWRFDGAACLLQIRSGMLWWTQFWNDTSETDVERPVALSGDMGLKALVAAAGRVAGHAARRVDRLLATRAAVEGEGRLPPNYEVFDDNEALAAACHPGGNAVALFGYVGEEDFESLCRAVCDVRRRCGRKMGIMVRERQWTLRHEHELLLRGLGINMVAGRGVSFSRLQILIGLVREQRFSGPIVDDYRAALAAASAGTLSGYLSVPRFCEHVGRILERGRSLRLPHVLVRLRLRAQAGHLSALESCRLTRGGDVCTASADSLFLFLFSCPEPDVDHVLRRVFMKPLSALFEEVAQFRDVDEQISDMAAELSKRPAADYTDVLADIPPVAAPLPGLAKLANVLTLRKADPGRAPAPDVVETQPAGEADPLPGGAMPPAPGRQAAAPYQMPLRLALRRQS